MTVDYYCISTCHAVAPGRGGEGEGGKHLRLPACTNLPTMALCTWEVPRHSTSGIGQVHIACQPHPRSSVKRAHQLQMQGEGSRQHSIHLGGGMNFLVSSWLHVQNVANSNHTLIDLLSVLKYFCSWLPKGFGGTFALNCSCVSGALTLP